MKAILSFRAYACLFLISISAQVFSQTAIECRRQLNQVDSLCSLSNFDEAFKLYEEASSCHQFLSATRFYGMSNIYFNQGSTEKAKENLLMAVKKGIVNLQTFDDGPFKFYEFCTQLGGKDFLSQVLDLHHNTLKQKLTDNREFLEKFRSIEERDQNLRNYHMMGTYAIYDWTGFTEEKQDSIVAQMLEKSREKIIPVIDEYIQIISDKGYVMGDDEVFGMASIPVLINHSCRYNEEVNLDSIYLHSIKLGTISPKPYAWFIGYRAEILDIEDPYYYTRNSDFLKTLNEEEKKRINKNRWEIGLPLLPKNIYMPYSIE